MPISDSESLVGSAKAFRTTPDSAAPLKRRALRRMLPAALLCLSCAGPTVATELLYVYDPDCPACRRFDTEAGRIYPRTREAERLPLRKILLSDWKAGRAPERACTTEPVVGTPTFLLISDCTELDRITGYSSDEGFWMGLARMMRLVAPPGSSPATDPGAADRPPATAAPEP